MNVNFQNPYQVVVSTTRAWGNEEQGRSSTPQSETLTIETHVAQPNSCQSILGKTKKNIADSKDSKTKKYCQITLIPNGTHLPIFGIKKDMNLFAYLTDRMLLAILSSLDRQTLRTCLSVCKTWYSFITDITTLKQIITKPILAKPINQSETDFEILCAFIKKGNSNTDDDFLRLFDSLMESTRLLIGVEATKKIYRSWGMQVKTIHEEDIQMMGIPAFKAKMNDSLLSAVDRLTILTLVFEKLLKQTIKSIFDQPLARAAPTSIAFAENIPFDD